LRPEQRIVTRIPLTELWDETGAVSSERIRTLDQIFIQELLRVAPVQFIVANVGTGLRWIPMQQTFEFWKAVRPQIAEPLNQIPLEQFPNATALIASEWRSHDAACLILLEQHH
jgi:hypothetical protein